ncbi:MAG: carboxypeptidase-like regulatory domain-containing protein [Terracidiphilus sp.]
MRIAKLALVCSLSATLCLYAECRAHIAGRVIDETGKPVSEAQVSLFENRGGLSHKAVRYFPTDSNGTFNAEIDLTEAAQYWIIAKKEAAGYPDTTLAFYDNREPLKLTLNCHASISGVIVTLGPKAAYITRITITDKRNGEPVSNASITLRRLKSPIPELPLERFSISTSATLMKPGAGYLGLPVPSNVDVAYQISAPGFRSSLPEILHLSPLKMTTVSVSLDRSHDGSASPIQQPTQ